MLAALSLAACGGDSATEPPDPPAPVVVNVTPSSTAVDAGATATFSASVSNATNAGVTWTASGGTVAPNGANATWTAPGTGGSYTVTATSIADATKSASATVTVRAVGLSVTPATATIGAGDTVALAASVSNAVNGEVTWSASAGAIVGSGASVQWAAPVTGGDYTVTATSVLDPARSASATVTVTPVTVTVAAAQGALFRGAGTTLTATVGGTSDPSVTWRAACGTISGTGGSVQYTAPESAGDCVVTATSVRDPATSGADTLTVRRAWRVAALDDTDDGACTFQHCSFREALAAANAAPDADSILLLPGASSARGATARSSGTLGTITLTAPLPFIDTPVEIVGPGASALTIDANASPSASRGVFYFRGDIAAGARGLTLRGGRRQAGGGVVIDDGARVTLRDVHVRDNVSVDGAGGGVIALRGGRGTFVDVEITGNRTEGALSPGGGLSVEQGSMIAMTGGRIADNVVADAFGGGVRVINGALMLDGTVVADNRAPDTQTLGLGGGLFADGPDAVVQFVNVTVEGNQAGLFGGGLSIRGGTTATIAGGLIRQNEAILAGGIELGDATLVLTGTEILGNTAAQRGGGVFVFGEGTYTHEGGRIAQNAAGNDGGGGLYLQQNASLALTDVAVDDNTVTGNNGGGIWAAGNAAIAMTRGSLSRNTGAIVGGGLFLAVSRPVALIDVVVEDNRARDGGGGLFFVAGADLDAGAIRGGRIAGNATSAGGGGGIYAENIVLDIEGTTFAGNTATQGGGALLALGSGAYTLTDVVAEDNAANIGGAFGFSGTMGIAFERGTVRRNTSATVGGGLWKAGASSLTMTGTAVLDNVAATQGGGIQLSGPGGGATLTGLTVRGNTATGASGGGLTAGVPTTVTGSTFSGNTAAGIGGGIFAASLGNAVIRNSTFSANVAVTGGGIAATGPAALTNLTLVANRANDYGGGIATNNAGAMTITNVLLAGNLVADAPQNCGTGGTSTITSAGGNLADDAACPMLTQGTDRPNTAAGVNTTLADNGGGTFTHALLEGSAAVNAGVTSACPTTDQRGFSRAGACDIGAFEFGGQPPAGVRAARAVRRR